MNLSRDYTQYDFKRMLHGFLWYTDKSDPETWILLGRNGEIVTTDNGQNFTVLLTDQKLATCDFQDKVEGNQVIKAKKFNIRPLVDHLQPFKTSILERGKKQRL
jgi:hypothetical protein